MTAASAAMVTGWWLSGLFIVGEPGAYQLEGLGDFSMNLLAPFTPSGWSSVLPDLPVESSGQRYEGFLYLGLGVLVLALVAGGMASVRRPRPARGCRLGAAVVGVCVLMALFALSPRVTFGDRVVVDVSGPLFAPLSIFRASGRFAWPLTYVTLTAIVLAIVRRTSTGVGASLLGVGVAMQLWDLHGAHAERWHTARDETFHAWSNPLPSKRWPRLLTGYSHVVVVAPPYCGNGPVAYQAVLRLAALNGLTANVGTVSRRDPAAGRAYCEALRESVDTGALDPRTIYLVSADDAERLNRLPDARGRCTPIDGLWACGVAIAPPQ